MIKNYILNPIFLLYFFINFSSSYAQSEVDNCIKYSLIGDYKQAIEFGKKAVSLYPKNVNAYLCLGMNYYRLGEFKLALEIMKKAEGLAASLDLGDLFLDSLLLIYNLLGLIYYEINDLDTALLYFNRNLYLSRVRGDKESEVTALNNIARIYYTKNELDRALYYYEQSLKIEFGDEGRATTYNNIALIYVRKKDYKKAIKYLKDAIEIGKRVGDFHGVAIRMHNLGDIYREIKVFSKAEKLLKEALTRMQKIGNQRGEALVHMSLSDLYRDMGNLKLAKEHLISAYMIFIALQEREYVELVEDELLKLESSAQESSSRKK